MPTVHLHQEASSALQQREGAVGISPIVPQGAGCARGAGPCVPHRLAAETLGSVPERMKVVFAPHCGPSGVQQHYL